jgi:hypothetical protein
MTTEIVLNRLRRILLLDDAVFEEIRDDATFTPVAAGLAAGAVFAAALGAAIFGETVLDSSPEGWVTDTIVLGTLFTLVLFGAGAFVTYLVLTQVFGTEDVAADDFARVSLTTHFPYALGLLVMLPEVGFTFGILSVLATVFYSIYGIGAAFRAPTRTAPVFSVLAGSMVWLLLIPIISDPGSNWVTGVFVYSLIA